MRFLVFRRGVEAVPMTRSVSAASTSPETGKRFLASVYNRCPSRSPFGREVTRLRWRIAIIVSAAIAISYLDRQTLPVAVKAISKDIPLTNVQFSNLQSAFLLAYAFMYAGGGKLSDTLGTRRGFMVIMIF